MKLFEDLMEKSAKFADKATKVASEAFEQTKVVAGEAMDKGKKKVNELELKNDLSKAQKQLGELYYVMRKTGEMNEELLTQYYNNVADIEAKLEALNTEEVNESEDYSVVDEVEVAQPVEETAEEFAEDVKEIVEEAVAEVKDAFEEVKDTFEEIKAEFTEENAQSVKVCPSCGAQADEDDVFCRECGAKIGE